MIGYPFSFHRDQIIEKFLSTSSHSPMVDDWPTSDVLFLFIEIRPLNNFFYNHNIRQSLMIDEHPMSFFSSSRSDYGTIFLTMNTFADVWWLINIRCPFSLYRDEIIEEFLWRSAHSAMVNDWPTSDVLFLFMEVRPLNNFSYHHNIRQCLWIDQHPMSFSLPRDETIEQFLSASSHSPMFDDWETSDVFFSSSRSEHWTISHSIITFANVWLLTSIRFSFARRRDQIINEFLGASSHSWMFVDWQTSDILFLFIEIRALYKFPQHHCIRQCVMIDQHPMSFFSSSRSHHWTKFLKIMRFANVWWLTWNRCPFSLYRDEIIEEFLWRWAHSPMFDDLPTFDVTFLFIEIRPFYSFSENDEIRQCLMIDRYPMSFLSSSRSGHWTISLKMNTFANIWSLINILLSFSLHRDQIIEQFRWRWTYSRMFDGSATFGVLFLFFDMILLNNFSYHHNILHCLMIDQHPMSFFSSSGWDHWTISLKMKAFANVWWLTNIWCPFSLDRDQIIEQFLWQWTHPPMFDR